MSRRVPIPCNYCGVAIPAWSKSRNGFSRCKFCPCDAAYCDHWCQRKKWRQHKDVCRYHALVPFIVNHLLEVDIFATRILADRNARRYAARNPRLLAAACCALGVMSWWLTKGSIGSASRRCNMHAHWCLTVTKKVETRCGYTPATRGQTLVEHLSTL